MPPYGFRLFSDGFSHSLKANLMSINQLCDQNLNVKLTKNSYKMLNKSGEVVLEGSRSFDNCYQLIQAHMLQNFS